MYPLTVTLGFNNLVRLKGKRVNITTPTQHTIRTFWECGKELTSNTKSNWVIDARKSDFVECEKSKAHTRISLLSLINAFVIRCLDLLITPRATSKQSIF